MNRSAAVVEVPVPGPSARVHPLPSHPGAAPREDAVPLVARRSVHGREAVGRTAALGPLRTGRATAWPVPARPGGARPRSAQRGSARFVQARPGAARPGSARPGSARPVVGRLVSPRRYAIRRAVATALLGVLATVAVVALGLVAEAADTAQARAGVPAGTTVVAVRPGETVWEVARRAVPQARTTAVVERIVADNGLAGALNETLPAGLDLRVPR